MRPDVVVLNYSLIGFRKYLATIQRTYGNRLFATRDTTYLKNNFDYFLFSNSESDSLTTDAATFLHELIINHNPYSNDALYYKDEPVLTYYAKKLYFNKGANKPSGSFSLKNHLFMNEYMLLDIINTAAGKNIFFTFENDLLQNLLTQKGYVLQLEQ